jgi:hypothetical protein
MPDIRKAAETLREYKKGKANLEARIKENERWYKMRHWEMVERSKNPGDPEPASAWLLNSLANKHADAMDNYPEPVVLPREEGDRANAEMLSAIMPVVMERQEFEETYEVHWWRKLRSGTGIYGVFWDKAAENGLGDIAIKSVDVLSLYWEPGVNKLEESRNLFVVTLEDNDSLLRRYPQLEGRLGDVTDAAQYIYDESITTEDKTAVVDWYYKVMDGTRAVLHYCKFVGETILYATEDDERMAQTGLYAHGKYPFVCDTLFPVEGSPVGFGWLDVCKDPQMYIDKLDQSILKNAIVGAKRRYFVRSDGQINEAEYSDTTKDFVHYQGSGNPQESILPIELPPLNNVYPTVRAAKIDELKETSGNRDFSQGGTSSGVTAASAIAALQEAGSKLSRDMIRASYRAFRNVCYLVLELIREFYTEDRFFRIQGEAGAVQFVRFNSAAIAGRPQSAMFGTDMGMAQPIFDIEVKAQKRNAFSTVAQNELAKEFFAAGFFNPQLSDQALACIEMMDFEGKQRVEQRIQQNGTMYNQLMQMQAQMAQMTDIINGLTGGALGGMDGGQAPAQPTRQQAEAATSGGIPGNSREGMAMKAREKAQKMTEVRA